VQDYAESFAAILALSQTDAAREIAEVTRARAGGEYDYVERDLPTVYNPEQSPA
jgi:hypothetical protein